VAFRPIDLYLNDDTHKIIRIKQWQNTDSNEEVSEGKAEQFIDSQEKNPRKNNLGENKWP
jgi:hypothetical protein